MDAEVAESNAEDVVDVVVPQDLVPPQFPEVAEAKAEDIVMPLPPVAQQQDLVVRSPLLFCADRHWAHTHTGCGRAW